MEKLNKPPHIKFWEVLKNPTENQLDYFLKLSKYGDILKIPLTSKHYLINTPEGIQHILNSNFSNYTKEGTSYRRLQDVLGPGLLTNSGEAWQTRRADLQPMMYYKNLVKYEDIINFYINDAFIIWRKQINQSPFFNLTQALFELTTRISAAILFGIDVSNCVKELLKLVNTSNNFVAKSFSTVWWLPTFRNVHFRISKAKLDHLLLKTFQNKNPLVPQSLLEIVVEQYKSHIINEEQFLGDVKNFFIAGHETTGNVLSWAFYLLLRNPENFEKLHHEINFVVGNHAATLDDLPKLEYTEMILNETMRLYPPIWLIERRAINEDKIEQYFFPKNAIMIISPYTIQRHIRYWQEPNKFFPERFLPENSLNRPKNVFIPFGLGPRVCIGKQLALLIAKMIIPNVIKNFNIELANQRQIKPETLITLRPKTSLIVKMSVRK